MILGIGIDICEVKRISKTLKKYDGKFQNRCFTEIERKKCDNTFNISGCYAKRFAAKEAMAKALGTGISKGISWKQLEVENLQGNFSKAKRVLKWKPKKNIKVLVKEMIEFELKENG